jgi:hypothetical protein
VRSDGFNLGQVEVEAGGGIGEDRRSRPFVGLGWNEFASGEAGVDPAQRERETRVS